MTRVRKQMNKKKEKPCTEVKQIIYLTKERKKQLKFWARKHSPEKLRKIWMWFNNKKGMAALPSHRERRLNFLSIEGDQREMILYLSKKKSMLLEENIYELLLKNRFIFVMNKEHNIMVDNEGMFRGVFGIVYSFTYASKKDEPEGTKKFLKTIYRFFKELHNDDD